MAKTVFTVQNRKLFDAARSEGKSHHATILELQKLRSKPFGNDRAKDKAQELQLRADVMIGHMADYCERFAPQWGVKVSRGVNDVAGFWEKYAVDQFNMRGPKRSDLGHYAEKAARQKWSELIRDAGLKPVDTRGGKRAGAGRKRKEEEKGKGKSKAPKAEIAVRDDRERAATLPTWKTVASAKDWLAHQFALIEKAGARNPDIANDKAVADTFAAIHKLLKALD